MKKYNPGGSKKFTEILRLLVDSKVDNVQAMIKLSFSRLDDLKKYYSDWAVDVAEDAHKESAAINNEKWMQVNEAIEAKKGNEEQVWDCLYKEKDLCSA